MRVQALHSTLETATLALSQLRRTAPSAAAGAYTKHSAEQAAATAAAIASLNAAAVEEGAQVLDIEPLERQGEVERAYGRAVGELGDLKSGLPATAARLERARKAAEHVEGTR
jgi:Kinetochore protein Mis14 like